MKLTTKRIILYSLIWFSLLFEFLPSAAVAEEGSPERLHKVLSRALGFVRSDWSNNSTITIALVYKASSTSENVATNLKALFAQNASASKQYHILLVADSEINGAQAKSADAIVFLAGTDQVCGKLAPSHQLTITTDRHCIERRACVLGIDLSSNTAIYLDEERMRKAGIDFDSVFKFMVKKV